MDCVLTYHTNPLTCGVAKFNHLLAQHFDIPLLPLFDPDAVNFRNPLLSIKPSEFKPEDLQKLREMLEAFDDHQSWHIFFHDFLGSEVELFLVRRARVVYCGNRELAEKLRQHRDDIIELWAPPMLLDEEPFKKTKLSIFSFGMFHKIQIEYYKKLRAMLDDTKCSYSLYFSTVLHEGTTLDGKFEIAVSSLSDIFEDQIYFLGYLSDIALYNYLLKTTYFAAFFPTGVRANNTSVLAAMKAGAVVLTNLDQYSPGAYAHMGNLIDILQCRTLPTEPADLARISAQARKTAKKMEWSMLIEEIRKHETILL